MRDAKKTQIRGHFEQYIYRIKKSDDWFPYLYENIKVKVPSAIINEYLNEKAIDSIYIGSKGKLRILLLSLKDQ